MLTCLLLQLRGFRIIATRYRPPYRSAQSGEIDIIAKRFNLFIFVEVKRRSKKQEETINALTLKQQKRITRTARIFLAQQHDQAKARFDAVFFNAYWWPTYVANAWMDDLS